MRSSRGCARAMALAPCAGRRPTALIQTYSTFGFGGEYMEGLLCMCNEYNHTARRRFARFAHWPLPKQSRVLWG